MPHKFHLYLILLIKFGPSKNGRFGTLDLALVPRPLQRSSRVMWVIPLMFLRLTVKSLDKLVKVEPQANLVVCSTKNIPQKEIIIGFQPMDFLLMWSLLIWVSVLKKNKLHAMWSDFKVYIAKNNYVVFCRGKTDVRRL